MADDGDSGVEVFEWDAGYNVPILPNGVDPGTCRRDSHAVIPHTITSTPSGLYFAGQAAFVTEEDVWVLGVMNYTSYRMRLLGYPATASHRRAFQVGAMPCARAEGYACTLDHTTALTTLAVIACVPCVVSGAGSRTTCL